MGSLLDPTFTDTFSMKRMGYKIVHLVLTLITTSSMLKISLFCLLYQNIQKPSEVF